MLNFALDELRLIVENKNIDGYKPMPKNQLIDLFSTSTNTLVNIKKPVHNHIEEIRPMIPKEKIMLKNLRVPDQIEKIFKRKDKKIVISNLRYLLTLCFPIFPFDPPENIRKPLIF